MKFLAVHVLKLLSISLSYGNNVFSCRQEYKYIELDDAYTCRESSLVNLTKPTNVSDYSGLTLVYASSKTYNAPIGEVFFLHCCFYSQPYCPRIKWYKDGEEIDDNRIEVTDGGRALKIFATRDLVGRKYTCEATTPFQDESYSHSIMVKGPLYCVGDFSVTPSREVLEVERGQRKVLQWVFYCTGKFKPTVSGVCRLENGTTITELPSYYNVSQIRNYSNFNTPPLVVIVTIFNFTRNDNITCKTTIPGSPSGTYILVEKECKDPPSIRPKNTIVKVLNVGLNYTMKCVIYCLHRRDFDKPVWRDGRGKIITSNSTRFRLGGRDLSRNGYAGISEPSFEMIINIVNFTTAENISCHVSKKEKIGKIFSLQVGKSAKDEPRQQDDFLKTTGVWIITPGFFTLFCVVFIVWYRKKKNLKPQIFYRPNKQEVAAQYDAFISYSEADGGSFVRSTLKPMLEDEGYTLSLHYETFVPGTAIIDNIIDSIYESRRIVTVVTPKFLESEWCRFEVDQGLHRAIEKPNTLVVIMLSEIPKKELPKSLGVFLSEVNFLQWDDGNQHEMCKKLKNALGSPFTINSDGPEKTVLESARGQKDNSVDACDQPVNNIESSNQLESDNRFIDVV